MLKRCSKVYSASLKKEGTNNQTKKNQTNKPNQKNQTNKPNQTNKNKISTLNILSIKTNMQTELTVLIMNGFPESVIKMCYFRNIFKRHET